MLAMKKRGFGEGKWNGVGGKVDTGESVEDAVRRECTEEIEVSPKNIEYMGRLHFYIDSDPDFYHDCRIFQSTEWEGQPSETEEMRPKWFEVNKIPYDSMWPDDEIWMPILIEDKLFTGKVLLGHNSVIEHDIKVVKSVEELK